MNKTPYILLAAALFSACSINEALDITEGEGRMDFSVQVNSEVESASTTRAESDTYTISADLVPTTSELKLEIYEKNSYSDSEITYELYKEYASVDDYDTPAMPAGNYTAVVTNGGDINEESETNAVFADSVDFVINSVEEVGSTTLTATLQNSIIKLEVTDDFNNYFAGGATLKLTTDAGSELELNFPLDADEVEKILFVTPGTKLYLEGSAVKQDPGTGTAPTVTFTKNQVGTAVQGAMNSVLVDASETGGATITITINDTITTVSTTTVDVNSGNVTTETEV